MREWVEQICGLSIFCGLALSITPEGSVKKAVILCCTAVMMLSVVQAFRSFDYTSYSLELSRYRELGKSLTEEAEEKKERLSRVVIEREYEEYIINSAEAVGIQGFRVEVSLRWDTAGFWVPSRIRMSGTATKEMREKLGEIIGAEFGLDTGQQEWITNED